jgi:hypothetical protein
MSVLFHLGMFLVAAAVATAAVANDRVRQAIDRATVYLIQTQQRDGTWNSVVGHELGETALAGMAILAGGKPANDLAVLAAATAVRERAADDWSTYDTALAIMFLDRLGLPHDSELLGQLGQRLAGGQGNDGAWTYSLQRGFGSGGDNSNTQFAALASWVSRRHEVGNDAVLQRLDQYFRNSFNPADGGWGYSPGFGATPTMTCAGLVGIAIPKGAKGRRTAKEDGGRRGPAAANDPMARRALEALGIELKNADRDKTSELNTDLYFFWSLERVAVIYDVKDIGGVDWYQWGSQRLVAGQSPNGEWRGTSSTKGWPFSQAIGTSFGILFLSRANVAADLTAAIGSGGGVGEPPPGRGGGTPIIGRPMDGDVPPPAVAPTPTDSAKRRPASPRNPPPKPAPGPGVLDPL